MRLAPATPAFEALDSTLLVNLRPDAELDLRITSWDDGLTLRRDDGNGWRSHGADPEIILVAGPRSPGRERFVRGIPLAARRLVAPIRSHQLTLLRLLRWCEGADDLLASAPVLAWLLAGHLSDDFDAALGALLLRRPRIAMLSSIVGRRVTPAALRLLAKYRPGMWTERGEWNLHQLLKDPELVAWCGHEASLDPDMLEPLLRHREYHAARFLRAALRRPLSRSRLDRLARRDADAAVEAGLALGRADARQIVFACKDLEQVCALRVRWEMDLTNARRARMRADVLEKCAEVRFGPPPQPGTATIVPITLPIELLDEGRDMGHCASDQLADVLAGCIYFYRVLAPERATLSVRERNGILSIEDLRGPKNARVKRATRDAVQSWLRSGRGERRTILVSPPTPEPMRSVGEERP